MKIINLTEYFESLTVTANNFTLFLLKIHGEIYKGNGIVGKIIMLIFQNDNEDAKTSLW